MNSNIQTHLPELSRQARAVQNMFDRIAPRYDLLNRLLSLRQDVRWRRALCQDLPRLKKRGQSLLDVACGTGDILCEVLKRRPDFSSLTGLDLSLQMLEHARMRKDLADHLISAPDARQIEASRVSLVHGSATALPFAAGQFEAVTISFGLRNVDDRKKALGEFSRVLVPKGKLFVLEFFPLERSVMAFLFELYFKRILPFVGGLISDKDAYRYLPESVSTMPSVQEFNGWLAEAGLRTIQTRSWLFGGCLLIQAEKI